MIKYLSLMAAIIGFGTAPLAFVVGDRLVAGVCMVMGIVNMLIFAVQNETSRNK